MTTRCSSVLPEAQLKEIKAVIVDAARRWTAMLSKASPNCSVVVLFGTADAPPIHVFKKQRQHRDDIRQVEDLINEVWSNCRRSATMRLRDEGPLHGLFIGAVVVGTDNDHQATDAIREACIAALRAHLST